MPGSENLSGDADNTDERANLVHREILQLLLLIAGAVVAFFVTSAIAANNREMNLRDGAEWYQRGQRQLEAGDADGAIDSFRRATVKNRDEKRYVLALARALANRQQYDTARSALLALRESSPEDPDVNLQLARLAADRQDVTEAIRYYHNTVYAPWPVDQDEARRRLRVELIRFLLTHNQPNRALSETVALGTDLPDTPASHMEMGQLFTAAGDSRRALDQFQRALRLAPNDGAALTGAGQAAFQIRDYILAQQYFRRAPEGTDSSVRETRELVDLVVGNDPLAARLGSVVRRRRLVDNFSYADGRLQTCVEQQPEGHPLANTDELRDAVATFAKQLARPSVLDEDTIEAGVELIYRMERDVAQACPPPSPLDRALILIGQRHGADQR